MSTIMQKEDRQILNTQQMIPIISAAKSILIQDAAKLKEAPLDSPLAELLH